MHTCTDSKDLDIHVLDRWMPATKTYPACNHPRRRNMTNSMAELKNSHIHKNLTQNVEPHKYSWGTKKKKAHLFFLNPPVSHIHFADTVLFLVYSLSSVSLMSILFSIQSLSLASPFLFHLSVSCRYVFDIIFVPCSFIYQFHLNMFSMQCLSLASPFLFHLSVSCRYVFNTIFVSGLSLSLASVSFMPLHLWYNLFLWPLCFSVLSQFYVYMF